MTKIGQRDCQIQHVKMAKRGVQKSSPKSTAEILKLREHKGKPYISNTASYRY